MLKFSILLSVFFVFACSSGTKIPQDAISALQSGSMTASQLEAKYGEPDSKFSNANYCNGRGGEMWTYMWGKRTGLSTAKSEVKMLTFDSNGRLCGKPSASKLNSKLTPQLY